MRLGNYNRTVQTVTNWAVVLVSLVATALLVVFLVSKRPSAKAFLICSVAAVTTAGVSAKFLHTLMVTPRSRRANYLPQSTGMLPTGIPPTGGPSQPVRPRLPVTIASRRGSQRKT